MGYARRVSRKEVDNSGMPAEGRYFAEVSACEEKSSKSGDDYYNLSFTEVGTGRFLCYDIAMLEGKGAGIGVKKLKAVGGAVEEGDEYAIKPAGEVIGGRVYLHLVHESYGDKTRCVPDFKCDAAPFGYEPCDPPSVPAPSAPSTVPDPFSDADGNDNIPF